MNSRGIAWRNSFYDRVNLDAATALAALAAVVSAAGAVQQGETARKSAEYQAAIAENNALAARQQAEHDERQHREKARQVLSAQRAKAAKGGVLTEQGSPLFVSTDTGESAEIDALNIRRGGQLRATDYQSQAALGRFQGQATQQQSYLQAGSSLLSAAGSAYTDFRKAEAAKRAAGSPV